MLVGSFQREYAFVYVNRLEHAMLAPTVKVFITGNSQAVRLPKAFRVTTREM